MPMFTPSSSPSFPCRGSGTRVKLLSGNNTSLRVCECVCLFSCLYLLFRSYYYYCWDRTRGAFIDRVQIIFYHLFLHRWCSLWAMTINIHFVWVSHIIIITEYNNVRRALIATDTKMCVWTSTGYDDDNEDDDNMKMNASQTSFEYID